MKYLIGFVLLISLNSNAQTAFDEKEIKSKYPDSDIYFLTDKGHVNIEINDDKLEVYSDYSSEILMLNDKASMFSHKSIYFYEENEEISNLKAASYIPQENGKLKKMEVEKTFTHKPMKDNVFYDDLKEIYFDYPSLKPGAVASSSYREKQKDPRFIAPFYLANYSPTGLCEFSVTFPKDVILKYVLKGDSTGIDFSKKESKNETTYTWRVSNQRGFNDEQEEGNSRIYTPHVILFVDKYKVKDKSIALLSDVDHLYKWYYTHISELINAKSPVIQQLADSLTKNVSTNTEKIKKIYYWVQENTKYLAFEYGLGGFVPRPAELVCTRRYGDCKDKASLIYALLKAAGVNAYFTWIGTREIPYTYSEIPTPITDNHMIISLQENGKWIFLDGTANGLLYGYPSAFIQGKEALIAINPDSFQVVKVPIVEKEKNFTCDSLNVFLDGTTMKGKGESTFGGYWKYDISNQYYYTAGKKRDEDMSDLFKFVNNKCKVDSLTYSGVTDYVDTSKFDYVITLPNYSRIVEKKLFVNLHLRRTMQGEVVEIEKRKTEEEMNYRHTIKQITVLNIPANYKLVKVPQASNFKNKNFDFAISYQSEGDKVVMEKVFTFDELIKSKDQFEDWNKMIHQLDEAYAQVVVLEQK